MHSSILRREYENLFAKLTVPGTPVKSSLLLQSYATIRAIKDAKTVSFDDAYRHVCNQYAGYELGLCSKLKVSILSSLSDIADQFIQLSFIDFLFYIVPDLVCEPERLVKHLTTMASMDTVQLVHHVIRIKYNAYLETEQSNSFKSSVPDSIDERLYQFYIQNERKHPLSKKEFMHFYRAINVFTLDHDYLKPTLIGVKSKDVYDLTGILIDQLQLSRAQCFQLIHDFFCCNYQAQYFANEFQPYNFIPVKPEDRTKLIHKALRIISKISPLEAICAISIRKKQGSSTETIRSESLVLPNDVTLENSLVYYAFSSTIRPDSGSRIAILFPSPCFVRKLLNSPKHINEDITFIFADANIAGALTYQSSDSTYAPRIGKNISFISYTDWLSKTADLTEGYTNLLLFASGLSYSQRENLYPEIFKRCAAEAQLCALESSESMETSRNYYFDNDIISSMQIALIPQGINNSTTPKRKVLVSCFIQNNSSISSDPAHSSVQLFAYTLNTTLGTQAISPMLTKPVALETLDPDTRGTSLRQLYLKELLSRKASGRTRNASFSYDFTPDIQIWCSKTYPKNNSSRPRLEAYICEPTPDTRMNSGCRERGNAIESTKKHTTKIPDEDVLRWLEEEYPFSVIIHRADKPEQKTNTVSAGATSIRDTIIKHYTQHLQGQNISLKTLWYLHPDLADSYSNTAYQAFEEMVHTAIGQQRVCDISAEECESLLLAIYPDLSEANLWKRFTIISTALDKAIEYGYSKDNDLHTALLQSARKDRLFAQVRRALTKKHLTEGELLCAYRFCTDKLSHGDFRYLGVLLRLMTGLESGIICGLQWADMRYCKEFHFYSFVITRQVKKDGTSTGFSESEDYICFPIPKHLQTIIENYRNTVGKVDPATAIVNSIPVNSPEVCTVTPQTLNRLTKEMITDIGISERKVVLPSEDDDFRETDLNKYHGDLMRENFRYWSAKSGLLNSDELAYLMRNKPTTTLGCFYCDFLNEASQLILYLKLCRWESLLAEHVSCPPRVSIASVDSQFEAEVTASISCRKSVILEINSQASAEGTVQIDSPFGVTYNAMMYKKEE